MSYYTELTSAVVNGFKSAVDSGTLSKNIPLAYGVIIVLRFCPHPQSLHHKT